MPRPRKHRICEGKIFDRIFKPTRIPLHELPKIHLREDELEVLRLCDLQGLFQEQAGERMGVSRGTVQRLLATAHKKVAQALTEGAALILGDVEE